MTCGWGKNSFFPSVLCTTKATLDTSQGRQRRNIQKVFPPLYTIVATRLCGTHTESAVICLLCWIDSRGDVDTQREVFWNLVKEISKTLVKEMRACIEMYCCSAAVQLKLRLFSRAGKDLIKRAPAQMQRLTPNILRWLTRCHNNPYLPFLPLLLLVNSELSILSQVKIKSFRKRTICSQTLEN